VGIDAGFGALWVADPEVNTVFRVNPSGGGVQGFEVPSSPFSLAAGQGAVWITQFDADAIYALEPPG
jgi:hypothetical protein